MAGSNGQAPARAIRHLVAVDKPARDPAAGVDGAPPNFGTQLLPQVLTFRGILSSLGKVYRPSDEALKASEENARFMRNDPEIRECIDQRQRSLCLLDWHLEPDDAKSSREVELCDQLKAIVEKTPRFMQFRENLAMALWYGRYAVQPTYQWRQVRGKMRLCAVKWRPVHGDKLVFGLDDGGRGAERVGIRVSGSYTAGQSIENRWTIERIRDQTEMAYGGLAYFLEPWERDLLAIHRHYIEDGEFEAPENAGKIHGTGIRSVIYACWFQKVEALAWLMEYLERSAFGVELWYYPWGNADAREQTRTAAQERIGEGRNIILVPKPLGDDANAYGVERIEPGMAGADVVHKIVTEYFGHTIKRYILGQTLTTEADSTGLGSNLASIHLDTYLQIVRYDAANLEETMTEEFVRPLLKWNFPEMANCGLRFVLDTEAPDVEAKLTAYRQAWEMGLKIRSSDVGELIGATPPDADEEVLANPQAAQGAGMTPGAGGQPGGVQPGGGPTVSGPGEPTAMAQETWRALERAKAAQTVQAELGIRTNEDAERVPLAAGGGEGQPATRTPHASGHDLESLVAGFGEALKAAADPGMALKIVLDNLKDNPGYYDAPGVQRYAKEPHEEERIVTSEKAAIGNPDKLARGTLECQIAAAAEATERDPSDEQLAAGNYRKGKFSWHGLRIAIEIPRGGERRGTDADGNDWSVTLPHHYGYILRTQSEADGDHLDVFVGPQPESDLVFVVDQQKASGRFDEHKVLIGFTSEAEAREGYYGSYSKGWTGLRAITPMTLDEFLEWVQTGDSSKSLAGQKRPEEYRRQPESRGDWTERYVERYAKAL